MTEARNEIYHEDGRLREGVVVVKFIRECGPYGYRVRWLRGQDKHEWIYLGRAEPGIRPGTYGPSTPLVFYQGRQRKLEERTKLHVGNWDRYRVDAPVEVRLDGAHYLQEVVS